MLRSVIDSLPAMIGYWDRDLRNVLGNKAYVEWFGKTPEQMHRLHIREVIGEDLFQLNLPYMQEALAGNAQHFDRTIVDASGRTRYSQASYIPDVDSEGEVHGFFVLVADVTERVVAQMALAEATAELERRATTDDLTGLPNRACFEERTEAAIAALQERSDDVGLGVVLIDLDGFKGVNDTFGHAAGDQLLAVAAKRLRGAVREPDMVARLGGDEFVVLMPELSDVSLASGRVERLVRLFREPFVLREEGVPPVSVRASVGIAIAHPGDAEASVGHLLRAADQMMYAAKQRGGDLWLSTEALSRPT
jgi:diguanylate cyclase (GGDEF)-like protein/PAS domain S-box-containing protein